MLGQAMVLKSVFNNFPIFRPILSAAGNPYLRITYLQKLTFGSITIVSWIISQHEKSKIVIFGFSIYI